MTRPFGIGIDLIEISRIREILNSRGLAFYQKTLNPEEIAYCQTKRDPAPSVAARFAAKEAIAKALGTGFGQFLAWHDITISHDALGKPIANFSAKGAAFLEKNSITTVHISLSHSEHYATAQALAWQGI